MSLDGSVNICVSEDICLRVRRRQPKEDEAP